jgi:hypothetical protein
MPFPKSNLTMGAKIQTGLLAGVCILLAFSGSLRAQETFRDNFSSVSYSNNDGTLNFSNDWFESGDGNDPSNGRIQITGGRLRFQNLDNAFITRNLDLSAATNAVLTLDFDRTSGNERVAVEMFDGSNWNEIASLNGDGSLSYTLSAAERNATAGIRFRSDSGGWGGSETVFIDNVLITATLGSSILIGDITVNEGDGTATFTATHVGLDTSGPFTVNFQTLDGTATAGTDYTATSGTLSFNGTVGDTEQITVPITDDTNFEGDETFIVQFTGSSDPTVVISDTATGTIADNENIFGNTPLALFREFDGYMDYTSTAGTLRTQPNTVDPCAITTSSSNTLTAPIPAGATIEAAYLYWAHSGSTLDSQVTFEGTTINAEIAYTTGIFGLNFYGMWSDVTSLVQSLPDPSSNVYDFSGLSIDNSSSYCNSTVVLGGWSLMIFYSHPSLPASTINLYQGFDGNQNSSSTFSLSGFYAIGSTGAKTTALSWEGDQTLANNESLRFTTPLSGTNNLTGDGDNNGTTVSNPFNSTNFDNTVLPAVNNTASHGVDLDTYDVSSFILPGETSATTQVNVGQDYVIMNAVVLKVPSNLITGRVFEDLTYGGGAGRDYAASGGVGLAGVTVELYDSGGTLVDTQTTNATGIYVFAGMIDGPYSIRVVNETVRSSRGGGAGCSSCLPVQTFKSDYAASTVIPDPNQVGGANPLATDPAAGTLTGAQSVGSVTIISEGAAGIDFGYNFNTIVNTNDTGQGSLAQFITNANNLDESGLDIEANTLFDPPAGVDLSVFMIPPSGDALGRTADPGFNGTYFDIYLSGALDDLSSDNITIDGRTQTAYSGDTNSGSIGGGGSSVGVSGTSLAVFDLPEIQVHRDAGDVFVNSGTTNQIANLSIFSDSNSAIRISGGSLGLNSNLLGVNSLGVNGGNLETAIEVDGGAGALTSNYIATTSQHGLWIRNTTSYLVIGNHFRENGLANCGNNVRLEDGSGIVIRENLIENAEAAGVDADGFPGGLELLENTITGSGQDATCFGGFGGVGARLGGSNSTISGNIIHSNGNAGLVLNDSSGSGNLISQNSFFNNGTTADALGIDLDLSGGFGDGVTLNDTGDTDTGPNDLANFPIIVTAFISGSELVVKGWTRPGSTLEFFFTDVNEGTAASGDNQLGNNNDYGEGQVYIATVVEGSVNDLDSGSSNYTDTDGNTDNTERYEFRIPLPSGTALGELITATASLSNSTSEFSPFSDIRLQTVITNRRITYRVNN